jgi:hypothetical protein
LFTTLLPSLPPLFTVVVTAFPLLFLLFHPKADDWVGLEDTICEAAWNERRKKDGLTSLSVYS